MAVINYLDKNICTYREQQAQYLGSTLLPRKPLTQQYFTGQGMSYLLTNAKTLITSLILNRLTRCKNRRTVQKIRFSAQPVGNWLLAGIIPLGGLKRYMYETQYVYGEVNVTGMGKRYICDQRCRIGIINILINTHVVDIGGLH